MLLNKLLASLPEHKLTGGADIEITGFEPDSRKIKPGNLFVAIKGLTVDSHDFISQAIEAGAVAIVGEKDLITLASKGDPLNNIAYIQVSNSREALGILASVWFDNPSKKLKVIGVTGTEGKTTTANLIYHILSESGKKVGLISTIAAKIGDEELDTGLHVTNPEALPLQELLDKMVKKDCKYAVLETTSQGLYQGRVAGVTFEIGVLTNITHDHLDYHKTWENYREAKATLFQKVNTAILNADDESADFVKGKLKDGARAITYGIDNRADIKAEEVKLSAEGTSFRIENKEDFLINISLLGKYNVSNTLAAITTCLELSLSLDQISKALLKFKSPEGRLEKIEEDNPPASGFSIFVDFAHTPNALEKVLGTLRDLTPADAKLIALYGSAGARDLLKRPAMGAAGAKYADITIFTADDPREESVEEITKQLAEGATNEGAQEVSVDQLTGTDPVKGHAFVREPDRKKAIELAISLARDGDILALLGKGHEKSLAVGKKEIPWSDQETARKALREQR